MNSMPPSDQDRFKRRSVAFLGRTLAECLQMFSLELEALRGQKILDVASGPGSFVAEVDFGLVFHTRAFRELARVTRRELRVAGMHTWTQPPQPHPYCGPVTQVLEEAGFAVELVPSDYDDGCQASGGCANQALVARRVNVSPPSS